MMELLSIPGPILLVAGLGLLLLWFSSLLRGTTGLSSKVRVVASDTGQGRVKKLYDPETGLVGQPDYIIEERCGFLRRRKYVPVEVKPSRRGTELHESDEMQLVVYLLVLRANYGRRAADYGYVRYKQATFRVKLTPDRVRRCLMYVEAVRRNRAAANVDRSHEDRVRCLRCGFRKMCGQNLA